MGRVVVTPGVALVRLDAEGAPALPADLFGSPSDPGAACTRCFVGSHEAYEVRGAAGWHLTVVLLARGTFSGGNAGALALVWAPCVAGQERDAMRGLLAELVACGAAFTAWPCDLDPSGAYVVPALAQDAGGLAADARAAWPCAWRLRAPGDAPDEIDPSTLKVTRTRPTGPLYVGEVLA